ncbi:MAG: PDR/VanB family oxidoreductase, partial [Kibdelosporangium sp.]
MDVVLTRKKLVAEDVVLLDFRGPAGFPVWEPGAHVDLLLPNGLQRQYSLCGDPADRSVLTVAVQRALDSRGGSSFVHDSLAEGDRIGLRGPRNNFALVPASRYLFVAGGIGITPIVPMLAAVDSRRLDWRLVYGGRSVESMAFADSLTARYGERVGVSTGLLDLDAVLAATPAGTVVYCCGPESLLSATQERCGDRPLYVERFTPRPVTGPASSFEVELSSGQVLRVPPEQSILQVLEEAGLQVLSSCQEGTCGTCETEVLA